MERLVKLVPWSEDGLDLLRRCNTPAMTEHLGGPESEEKLLDRHARYLRYTSDPSSGAWPFRVFVDNEVAASIALWHSDWNGEPGYEAGWATVPEFQGQGVASASVRLFLDFARDRGDRRWVVACPSRTNLASNGVCRSVGFEFFGECEVEYPPGTQMLANDWRFDLRA